MDQPTTYPYSGDENILWFVVGIRRRTDHLDGKNPVKNTLFFK
jgi:hypothetical protein